MLFGAYKVNIQFYLFNFENKQGSFYIGIQGLRQLKMNKLYVRFQERQILNSKDPFLLHFFSFSKRVREMNNLVHVSLSSVFLGKLKIYNEIPIIIKGLNNFQRKRRMHTFKIYLCFFYDYSRLI